jgi:ABC-type antimicrobial peptide transport system permease subunit
MLESIASIGIGGLLMLVIGYVGLFYMARIIDSRDPYEDEGDSDE